MKTICLLTFIVSILAAGGAFAADASPELRPSPPKGATVPTAAVTAAGKTPASPLSLSEYLGQVSTKHQGYQASDQTAKAAKAYADEGSLLFKPSLVGQGTTTSDGRSDPFDAPDKFHSRAYNLGVSEQTPVGFTGKLGVNRAEIELPASSAFPASNYTANWFSLDFSQSLLRNWNGREAKAQAELIQNGALAKSYAQSFITKNVLLEAESNYWRLALAREMVNMQKDAVDRAQRIFDWTNRRVRLQLADRAEGLQASTNLQARKLELKTALDDERVAAQAFNSSRGVLDNVVSDALAGLTPELIASFNVPARSVQRDDVKSAEFQAKSTAANANLSKEKDKPTVELFGSIPITEPESPTGVIAQIIPPASRPGTTIGLRLTAPLDLGTLSKAREGWAAEAQAADWTYQRKAFEEERDWQDLTSKFREAKDRLKLYTDLEKTQGEKLHYERDRQQRGRSTLQQVILFENDYEQAQLGRIRTLAELLTLNAQMKLYGVSYESR